MVEKDGALLLGISSFSCICNLRSRPQSSWRFLAGWLSGPRFKTKSRSRGAHLMAQKSHGRGFHLVVKKSSKLLHVLLLQQHRVFFILGDNIRNYCRQTPILPNVYVAGFDMLNEHYRVFTDVVLCFSSMFRTLRLVADVYGSYHYLFRVLFDHIRWPLHNRLLL